jgi:TatD DNase family protein
MIDSHCHLTFHKFETDAHEVIERAVQSGISAMINVGTQISSSEEVVNLSHQYDPVYASVGVHPHHADKVADDWLDKLEVLASQKKVVAIGECGMDFYSYASNGIVDSSIQEKIFRQQIELAITKKLPLQIHNRQAGGNVIRILSDYSSQFSYSPGVFHCFAGDIDILQSALDMGFYIGFDGNVTYPGLASGESTALSDIAKYTPLDRMLIETDSPYLTPIPLRGQRNEPKNAIIIGEFIAELKNVPSEKFDNAVTQNFINLFNISI